MQMCEVFIYGWRRRRNEEEKERKNDNDIDNNKKRIYIWYQFVIVGTLVADIRNQYLPAHGRWSPCGWHQDPEPT